jgi:hypothetical protein
MKSLRWSLVLAALLCAGCASRSYCLTSQKYDHVASIPPITGGDGLNIPNSPTALRVPPPSPGAPDEPFGSKVQDPKHPSHTITQCLDEPPPMPPESASATTTAQ